MLDGRAEQSVNRPFVALVALLLAPPGNTEQFPWRVDFRGIGPIRLGMTLAEVRQVLHEPNARLTEDAAVPAAECAYLISSKLPEAVGVMFLNERVARVDVSERGVLTVRGAAVGDSERQIKKLYPGIVVEPHHYNPETGHYMTYAGKGAYTGHALLFETDGARVESFRAGNLDGVALVEGCS